MQPLRAESIDPRGSGLSADEAISRTARDRGMQTRQRIDVNWEELDRGLDRARQVPWSDADGEKVQKAWHAWAEMLPPVRTTERTRTVVGESQQPRIHEQKPPERNSSTAAKGHGRNGAEEFVSARQVAIAHQWLKQGDRCPACGKGNVYGQKEPQALVRIVGQAPLAATVYAL